MKTHLFMDDETRENGTSKRNPCRKLKTELGEEGGADIE